MDIAITNVEVVGNGTMKIYSNGSWSRMNASISNMVKGNDQIRYVYTTLLSFDA